MSRKQVGRFGVHLEDIFISNRTIYVMEACTMFGNIARLICWFVIYRKLLT